MTDEQYTRPARRQGFLPRTGARTHARPRTQPGPDRDRGPLRPHSRAGRRARHDRPGRRSTRHRRALRQRSAAGLGSGTTDDGTTDDGTSGDGTDPDGTYGNGTYEDGTYGDGTYDNDPYGDGTADETPTDDTTTDTATDDTATEDTTANGSGPEATVTAYFDAINNRDFAAAWELGGKNLDQDYDSFVAGFGTTQRDDVTVTGTSGDDVSVTVVAWETDGTQTTFEGTYTVSGGVITSADMREGN